MLTLHTYYNIWANTPKQTLKYSLNNFPISFQIDSVRMLFWEQDLRSVDVYVCVCVPQLPTVSTYYTRLWASFFVKLCEKNRVFGGLF